MSATHTTHRNGALTVLLLSTALLSSACLGPSLVRTPVYDEDGIEVNLTSARKSGETLGRGFDHPAELERDRLEELLASLEVETRTRKNPKKRDPAIHPDLVAPLAKALSLAFREAGPDQTVGVQAVKRHQRLLVLNRKALTSFNAYIAGGHFTLDFSRVDWTIPKNREKDVLPTPRENEDVQKFRVVASDVFQIAGKQKLASTWPGAPLTLSKTADIAAPAEAAPLPPAGDVASEAGDVAARREVGDDIEAGTTEGVAADVADAATAAGGGFAGVSPEQLRALADLEEARRAGTVTEREYQLRRDEIFPPDSGTRSDPDTQE